MLTRKALGFVPAGNVQLIVGVAPFAEMVTLEGKGTGVAGITETGGNASVVVFVPFWNSTCQDPFVRAMLNGVLLEQLLGSVSNGAHGENEVIKVGVAEPAGVKIPAIDVPREPPLISAPN